MSRVKTFSRVFPAHHPKKGLNTFFIEKINKSLGFEYGIPFGDMTEKHFKDLGVSYSHEIYCACEPKFHTMRLGNKVKVGDKFSFRVWSGLPYRSKQVIICPDITIKKVWDIEIMPYTINAKPKPMGISAIYINGNMFFDWNKLATNDGLSQEEMNDWFTPFLPFKGQIICWNDKIEY